MKVNWIFVLISLGIAALVGYGFHAGTANLFLTLGGGFVLFALSAVFFVLFLVEHLIFAFAGFRQAVYIIITGILFLVYALIFYGVAKAVRQ